MSYVVIKCGGSVLEQLPNSFFRNIISLIKEYNLKPIIVHGGGTTISSTLTKLEIDTQFINGLRVTSKPVLDVVEMVLSGSVNKWIVRKLIENGGKSIGLSGVDGSLLKARPMNGKQELGFVGEVISVNSNLIETLLIQHYIPVISPVGIDDNGQRWNINGDLAAAAIAKAFQASLYIVSNVPGIIENNHVLHKLSIHQIEELLENGTITNGMIPKVQAAVDCLHQGVKEVVILNGSEKDSLIKFITNVPIGTRMTLSEG